MDEAHQMYFNELHDSKDLDQASDKICQCKKSRSSLFILNNKI